MLIAFLEEKVFWMGALKRNYPGSGLTGLADDLGRAEQWWLYWVNSSANGK